MQRIVEKKYPSGAALRIKDDGSSIDPHPYISIQVKGKADREFDAGFSCTVTDILDLLIELWPDEIAYQFKTDGA